MCLINLRIRVLLKTCKACRCSRQTHTKSLIAPLSVFMSYQSQSSSTTARISLTVKTSEVCSLLTIRKLLVKLLSNVLKRSTPKQCHNSIPSSSSKTQSSKNKKSRLSTRTNLYKPARTQAVPRLPQPSLAKETTTISSV
jgi:hypothetical protein